MLFRLLLEPECVCWRKHTQLLWVGWVLPMLGPTCRDMQLVLEPDLQSQLVPGWTNLPLVHTRVCVVQQYINVLDMFGLLVPLLECVFQVYTKLQEMWSIRNQRVMWSMLGWVLVSFRAMSIMLTKNCWMHIMFDRYCSRTATTILYFMWVGVIYPKIISWTATTHSQFRAVLHARNAQIRIKLGCTVVWTQQGRCRLHNV